MKLVKSTRGRVLWHSAGDLWKAQGRSLWRSADGGETWALTCTLPVEPGIRMLAWSRLVQRLLRWEVSHLAPTGDGAWAVLGFNWIWRCKSGAAPVRTAKIVGRRPLALCVAPGMLLYGEYRSNAERSPTHIWCSRDGARSWNAIWRFPGTIRHVHGVFYDPFSQWFWVTTGDDDAECGIWVTKDGFTSLQRVIGGSQQTRAVTLVFREDAIYYGSDAPEEINHLYRLERQTLATQQLAAIDGPVFFGTSAGGTMVFSTVCEPSKVNRAGEASVWSSADGTVWSQALSFRKDRWPKRLLQYGQVHFGSGPGDGRYVWLTPVATTMDYVAHCYDLA